VERDEHVGTVGEGGIEEGKNPETRSERGERACAVQENEKGGRCLKEQHRNHREKNRLKRKRKKGEGRLFNRNKGWDS